MRSSPVCASIGIFPLSLGSADLATSSKELAATHWVTLWFGVGVTTRCYRPYLFEKMTVEWSLFHIVESGSGCAIRRSCPYSLPRGAQSARGWRLAQELANCNHLASFEASTRFERSERSLLKWYIVNQSNNRSQALLGFNHLSVGTSYQLR